MIDTAPPRTFAERHAVIFLLASWRYTAWKIIRNKPLVTIK